MSKPFALTELHARLRAVIRRGPQQRPAVLQVGGLVLDPASRIARRDDVTLVLTATEFSLLHEFMRNPDVALTRSHLLAHVWDFDHEADSNVVDVFVGSLRSKIDRPFRGRYLQTVRGFGYRLASTPADGDQLDLSE
jgi:two-component system OmpR family response regulator